MFKPLKAIALAVMAVVCSAHTAFAEQPQVWELVNPSGEIERFAIPPAARIGSLEGKTVVLRWNGKHNGNVFLDQIAVNLAKAVPSVKIIKSYELDPSMNIISGNAAGSASIASRILAMKPDLVIGSSAD